MDDKLSREERIRVECLTQSVMSDPRANSAGIILRASKFEDYIKNGKAHDNNE